MLRVTFQAAHRLAPLGLGRATALSSSVKQGLEHGSVQVSSTKRGWALQAAAHARALLGVREATFVWTQLVGRLSHLYAANSYEDQPSPALKCF